MWCSQTQCSGGHWPTYRSIHFESRHQGPPFRTKESAFAKVQGQPSGGRGPARCAPWFPSLEAPCQVASIGTPSRGSERGASMTSVCSGSSCVAVLPVNIKCFAMARPISGRPGRERQITWRIGGRPCRVLMLASSSRFTQWSKACSRCP